MSVLESLLFAHRREYEERRRWVADLETLALRLRADATRLRGELERAGNPATGDAAASRLLIERYRKLAGSIAEIDGQIAAARAELAAAEQQIKRDETVRPQRAGRDGLPEPSRDGKKMRRPRRRSTIDG
jgi:chromosome segregation ATPase